MLKKIVFIASAFLCLTVSHGPAMAMYSGITDTVENVIQLLAKENARGVMYQAHRELPMVQTSSNAASDTNAQMETRTDSNAEEQAQPCTDSNAGKL